MPLHKKISIKKELEALGLTKEILENEILLKEFMYKNLSEVDINYIDKVFSSENVDQLFHIFKLQYMNKSEYIKRTKKRQFFFEQVLQAIQPSNQEKTTSEIKSPNLASIKNSKILNPSDKKRFIRMFFKGIYDYLSDSEKDISIEYMCKFVQDFSYQENLEWK